MNDTTGHISIIDVGGVTTHNCGMTTNSNPITIMGITRDAMLTHNVVNPQDTDIVG